MRSPTPAATSGTPGFPRLRAVRAAVRVEGYVAANRRASRPLSSCSARGGRSPWRTGTGPPRLGSTWTRPAACSPHSSPGALPPGKPTWWFDVCLSLCFRGNVVAAPVYAVRAGRPGGRAAAGRPAAGSESLVAARDRPAFAPVGGRTGQRCGGRCLWRSGAPGTVGGNGAAGAPPLTRLAGCPGGTFMVGLVQQHARVEARFKGKYPMFSAESIIRPGGPGGLRCALPSGSAETRPMPEADRIASGRRAGVTGHYCLQVIVEILGPQRCPGP